MSPTPSPQGTIWQRQPCGFALVATLSLSVVLVVMAVGLLSLSGISLRTSTRSEAMAAARANAKLALLLAIGDLQKHAGPDTRVTAPANLIKAASPNPHWAGVWKTRTGENLAAGEAGTYPVGHHESPLYLTDLRAKSGPGAAHAWLVSSPEPGKTSPDSSPASDWITLLTGSDPRSSVRVPRLPIAGAGTCGWWVSDENQKARLDLTDPHEEDEKALSLAVSHKQDFANFQVSGESGNLLDGVKDAEDEEISRIASVATVGVLPSADAKAVRENLGEIGHHLTTDSAGLFTDVMRSGLKRDLSAFLAVGEIPDDPATGQTGLREADAILPAAKLDRAELVVNRPTAALAVAGGSLRVFAGKEPGKEGEPPLFGAFPIPAEPGHYEVFLNRSPNRKTWEEPERMILASSQAAFPNGSFRIVNLHAGTVMVKVGGTQVDVPARRSIIHKPQASGAPSRGEGSGVDPPHRRAGGCRATRQSRLLSKQESEVSLHRHVVLPVRPRITRNRFRMNHRTALVPIALVLPCLAAAIPTPPPGNGQIEREVETIVEPKPPADDAMREFTGQRTTTGKLVLTASNGFFDPGIRAAGEAAVKDAAPDDFIAKDFEYLHQWTKEGATMRWHVWIETPGELFVNLHLVTDKAGAKLKCGIGDSVQTVETRSQGDAEKPQGTPLAFKIATPGWHTFQMELEKSNGGDTGKLHRVELFGPAAEKAAVLRTRWRPSAAHARFSSSEVAKPQLWVMTSRMAADTRVSSYSPITTPFGYYGTSFKEDGTSSGGANFSLWSYGRGKPTPQEQWAHLLATGSPEAEFGSFGHEGSGVKLRGDWAPFAGQKEVTVALRYEIAQPWIRWFGYYLDPETKRFRLYAAAAKWVGTAKKPPVLNPGSFVEQPGPPDRRRCGDLVRDIHRRGWMLDEQKKWHAVDTMASGKATAKAAKHWTTTPDGWFSTGMGGMARRPGAGVPVRLETTAVPAWLNDQAIADLHRMPATIGARAITASRDAATLKVPITGLELKAGEKATVTVYYDTQDCFTFFRDLGYSEVKTRFWQHHTEALPVKEGENTISLKGLSPETAYHLRVLVESPRGRVWSFESDTFTTGSGK